VKNSKIVRKVRERKLKTVRVQQAMPHLIRPLARILDVSAISISNFFSSPPEADIDPSLIGPLNQLSNQILSAKSPSSTTPATPVKGLKQSPQEEDTKPCPSFIPSTDNSPFVKATILPPDSIKRGRNPGPIWKHFKGNK
jgi:hypothetical protein